MFERRASPQILRKIIGEQLSGTPPLLTAEPNFARSRDTELASKIGKRILPPGFTLEDDPRIDHVGSMPLTGCYRFDDEGVEARRVTLVDDGFLRDLVMARAPRAGFAHSNGHARYRYDGIKASIANLVLSAKGGRSAKELRARLLDAVKASMLSYGGQ